MAGSGSSGGPPAPRAGAGPTVIAAALVVLVIGLGWLNHGGGAGSDNATPFARDVSRAIEQAEQEGLIPASQPAEPSEIGSSGRDTGQTSSTTVVIDPETGLEITINLPAPGTTGSSGPTDGTAGTTGTTGSGGSGTTATTRPGSSTTVTTRPPSTTRPTTTAPPTTPTTTPTTDPPTTPTTETPPSTGLIGDLLGGLTGALGSVVNGLL